VPLFARLAPDINRLVFECHGFGIITTIGTSGVTTEIAQDGSIIGATIATATGGTATIATVTDLIDSTTIATSF
jgi:hypothetical protein